MDGCLQYQTMSEEQLAALLVKLKDDAALRDKLQAAADLDAAVALAKEAGFDVSKADWLKYQAKQTLELSDEELEGVAGGTIAGQTIRLMMIRAGGTRYGCGRV
jgi:predicted ribosomally synthesized peptide with nif11-like leader